MSSPRIDDGRVHFFFNQAGIYRGRYLGVALLKSTKNFWHWLSTKPGLLLALFTNAMLSWVIYHFFGINASAMAYLMGAFTVFIFLVDNRDDRFLKGYFLIAYGVMIQFSYDLVFKKGLEGSHMAENIKMLLMMITIGATGAGGSLIATHSDRSSKDVEQLAIPQEDEGVTMRFGALERQVIELGRKLDRLIKLAGVACAGLSLVTLILILLFVMR
ncbi:hypothetical protein [Pseudomonas chlororaphis]|uniref:hypothetical protein n=1 Tax=Pseudomonas chlororaphis TaxID=587753 RepID=UPI000565C47D|nr:hypothetical protein [Pseudomonas chlororaphis]